LGHILRLPYFFFNERNISSDNAVEKKN